MKSVIQIMLTLILISFSIHRSIGQSDVDTITLKKGEVFDILLLSQNDDTNVELKSYFQVAFPVAKRMSYKSLPSFKVTGHNQGNLRPKELILGKWNDIELREEFLTQIMEEVPDFHERRRSIWAYFGLRYFEIEEDVSFKISRDLYQVATAYWKASDKQSSKYYKKWKEEVEKSGGEVLIQFKDGKSPFGYLYNPDYIVITSWHSEDAFRDFHEKMKKFELDNIQHVDEYILE